MAALKGEYSKFSKLEPLPPLVRKQRKLAAQLGDEHGSFVDQDKTVRTDIDELLVASGLAKGEGVLCLGYEVVHRERLGNLALKEDVFVERMFQEHGVDREKVRALLLACSGRGATAKWAEVDPPKAAKVRKPAA